MRLTIPREPDLQTMRRAEIFHARRGYFNFSRNYYIDLKTTSEYRVAIELLELHIQ
jgi:hypothetical protein